MNAATNKGLAWAYLLRDHPEREPDCEWNTLDGVAWHCLLCGQPQFAKYCNWSFAHEWCGRSGRWYWATLLGEQPQFANKCDCWLEFDEYDLAYMLQKQPSLAAHVDVGKQCGEVQALILTANPQAASRCNVRHFSSSDWLHFLKKLDTVPQGILDKCPWGDFNGNIWSELLFTRPGYAKYCRWENLDEEDWRRILYFHPEYKTEFNAHAKMKYEDLHLENWEPF